MSDENELDFPLPEEAAAIEQAVDDNMLSFFNETLQEFSNVEKMSGFELAKFIADNSLLFEQSLQILNDIANDFRTSTPSSTEELFEAFKFIELAGTTISHHFLAWAFARLYLLNRPQPRKSKSNLS